MSPPDTPTDIPAYSLPPGNRRVLLVRRPQGVPQPEDFALAIVEALHRLVDSALEGLLMRVVQRIVLPMVGEELAKVAVFVIAHRLIERERLPRHLDDAASVVER